MVDSHILLLSFPVLGAINPSIQFASHLIRMGVKVTLVTSVSAHRRLSKVSPPPPPPPGLTFFPFSDGYDEGLKDGDDRQHFTSEFKKHGSKAITEVITSSAKEGRPIMFLVYTVVQSWAAEVAREFHISSAPLWTQAANVFSIYYHFFDGYGDRIQQISGDPSCTVELPNLPPLGSSDLPSFLVDSTMFDLALPVLKKQIDALHAEANPIVLVNTFNELEIEAMRGVKKFKLVTIGPLVPSPKENPSETAFRHYVEWLDSKPQSSVVYVAFGSLAVMSKQKMEEVARALLESQRPFMLVIRETEGINREEEKLSCIEELGRKGMIVPWCSQVEVLSHPSLGCFVTHCGWNSSLESLVFGVPVVGYPLLWDQFTNAKLVEDVFRNGVRVRVNKEGIAESAEIKRCIEMVMGDGEEAEEIRRNAKKWKCLAKEAAGEGGSLHMNIRAFLDKIKEGL